MLADHRRLFAFDHWATLAILDAAIPVIDAAPKALEWLAHIAGAKRVWHARVTGGPSPLPVWPTLSIDECRSHLEAAHDDWHTHLAGLADDDLRSDIAYVAMNGQPFTSRLQDILVHVPMHGHHHRGQIAAAIRQAGGTPPVIDFIHATRQQVV